MMEGYFWGWFEGNVMLDLWKNLNFSWSLESKKSTCDKIFFIWRNLYELSFNEITLISQTYLKANFLKKI